MHYLTCLCIGADTHHCFDSLYYCIVWLIAIVLFDAIVLLICIGTLVHSLYNLLCIALYYWNVPLGLHAHITVLFAMYYCIVLLLKIMSNVWAERFKGTSTHLWMYRQRGLKVPPPIQGGGLETPKLVCFALHYLGMEHPSYCTIELMYHCIALFHSQVRSTQTIVLFTMYYYQMYSARTNWHKGAVRHMARVCPSTTQHGLNYHCIALHRKPVQRLVKVQGWCPHPLTHSDVIINCISVTLVRNTFHGCVEPMPCIGYVK